jgi:hypothetical protein
MNQNELEQFIESKLNAIIEEIDETVESTEPRYCVEVDGEQLGLTADQILSYLEPYTEPEVPSKVLSDEEIAAVSEECDHCDVVAAIDGVILNTLRQPGVKLSKSSTKNLVRLAQVRALYLQN